MKYGSGSSYSKMFRIHTLSKNFILSDFFFSLLIILNCWQQCCGSRMIFSAHGSTLKGVSDPGLKLFFYNCAFFWENANLKINFFSSNSFRVRMIFSGSGFKSVFWIRVRIQQLNESGSLSETLLCFWAFRYSYLLLTWCSFYNYFSFLVSLIFTAPWTSI